MPVESLAFAAAGVFLAVVTGMAIAGLLGLGGALRSGRCSTCRRWRILTGKEPAARCLHCETIDRAHRLALHVPRPTVHGHRLRHLH